MAQEEGLWKAKRPDAPWPPSAAGTKPLWWRAPARLAGLLLTFYIGVTLVLLALENRLVYHPTRATDDWLAPPNSRVQDVELQMADGTLIHAWWCPTENWEQAQGAVLYCHGNAGNLSHRGHRVAAWQQYVGTAVLIFDYPGYGRSAGKPSEQGCYAAADAAYDWLTRVQQVLPASLVIYGGSLGGGVAVDLASRQPHQALVLVSTFTSAPDVGQRIYPWLPIRWLMRNRFDSLAKIGRCKQPLFMAHGTADRVVPFILGQRLFEAAHEPKEFFALEGYDHDHHPDAELYGRIRQFLRKTQSQPADPMPARQAPD